MIDNTHNLNRQIAVTMAICTTFLICLLLLDFFAVFNFSEELISNWNSDIDITVNFMLF